MSQERVLAASMNGRLVKNVLPGLDGSVTDWMRELLMFQEKVLVII